MGRIPKEVLLRFSESGLLDRDWYLKTYPDVAEAGMDPAEHFLWLGARLGRRPGPSEAGKRPSAHPDRSRHFDAFFIDGTNGTASTSYRVDLIAEGLAELGWHTGSCRLNQVHNLLAEDGFTCRFLIIHRAYNYGEIREIMNDFRARGSIIVYDVDDLVFDIDALPFVDAYSHMPEAQKRSFERSFRNVREFVLNADFCTTSTEFLVDQLRKIGKPAYRIRNSFSRRFLENFSHLEVRRKKPEPFVVGYYSGTKTHQADFAVAAPALTGFMRRNKDVVFRLVGKLDLREYPQLAEWQHPSGFGAPPRVVTVSLMPHKAMLRDQLTCDVIIAPLEVGNPFCEAKSELKFFEASLAKCPMIAAGTRTFTHAIDGGRLALLASSTADWEAALDAVYHDYPAALERAEAAFGWVCDHYSQTSAAAEAMAAYHDFEHRSPCSVVGAYEDVHARPA